MKNEKCLPCVPSWLCCLLSFITSVSLLVQRFTAPIVCDTPQKLRQQTPTDDPVMANGRPLALRVTALSLKNFTAVEGRNTILPKEIPSYMF